MDLTIGQLIKILLGFIVVVAVILGLVKFGDSVIDFFRNVIPGNVTK